MQYPEALNYLDTFVNFERKPPTGPARENMGLARVRVLLERMGSPHADLKCLHIAGTKGKGSTSAMGESALRASGYRTGLFTSPHLVDVRERIMFDGRMIPADAFARIVQFTQPFLEKLREEKRLLPEGAAFRMATYFEILTDVAFLFFKEARAEAVVLEVGMGGRLDSTNVVTPVATGITNVSLDHCSILGSTVAEIAGEKAGILKPDVPGVVAPQKESAARVIKSTARKAGAPLWWVGREVTLECDTDATFSVKTPGRVYPRLSVPLWGEHQLENAAVAVGMLELFRRHGYDRITEDSVREGLANVRWPGRIQKVADSPATILDGAHNPESIRRLIETLESRFPGVKPVVVLGIADDKDWPRMAAEVASSAEAVLCTTSGNPRAVAPERIADAVRDGGLDRAEAIEPAETAFEKAREMAGPDGLVVATGSLYLVGRLLSHVGWKPV